MQKFNAQSLLAKVQAGQASTDEMTQGVQLLKAIENFEAEKASEEDLTILKAADLIETEAAAEETEEEAEADAPEGEAAEGEGAAEEDEAEGGEIQKSIDALTDGPSDIPEPGSLLEEIANQGVEDPEQTVNVAPVLQAQVAHADRICKCLQDLTQAVLAQNTLLTQVGNVAVEIPEIKKSLGVQAEMLKSVQATPAEGPSEMLKALQGHLGQPLSDALNRLKAVEETVNNRPKQGNPPRNGGTLMKSVLSADVPGGIGYTQAISVIQKSALPDFEKAEALGTLQLAVNGPRTFADVLGSYDLLEQAIGG